MREYNLTEKERETLDKKMRELLELCQIYHTPMFCSVAVRNSLAETEYMNITFDTNPNKIPLADDQIRHHILIASNGFVAIPKRDSVNMDMIKITNNS